MSQWSARNDEYTIVRMLGDDWAVSADCRKRFSILKVSNDGSLNDLDEELS